ncbi:MAG: hypothetical protein P4L69_13500 [Desulfosporosinus sp.]|nr:hypothetical protein [Desulfosporosinus sp.]
MGYWEAECGECGKHKTKDMSDRLARKIYRYIMWKKDKLVYCDDNKSYTHESSSDGSDMDCSVKSP